MSEPSRRSFITSTVGLVAGTLAVTSGNAIASSHEHQHGDSDNGLTIDSSKKDTCATCQYWGGMRLASKDKSSVTAQSMGWCNNPDSMNYQKLTNADHLMKKTGVWKKWSVL
jgi:anaerobic selenocysteine-containing dehydrogenase